MQVLAEPHPCLSPAVHVQEGAGSLLIQHPKGQCPKNRKPPGHQFWQVSCNFTCYRKFLPRNCNHEPTTWGRELDRPTPNCHTSLRRKGRGWRLHPCGLSSLPPEQRTALPVSGWGLTGREASAHQPLSEHSRCYLHRQSPQTVCRFLKAAHRHEERGRVQGELGDGLLP